MKYVRLFAAFFRVSVIGELAYRVNFFWQLLQSFLNLGISLGELAIIFSYTSTLGGWNPEEMLALVGVYFFVGGIIGLVIQPSLQQFIESVRDGTFDFTLTKPIDTQFIISIHQADIWRLIDMAMGLGVMATALTKLGETIRGLHAVEFIGMLVAGGVIIYSFWLILATLAFWFVRVENLLTIFQSMYEAGRWPISLYPGWLRYGLTFIVPVAVATTIPVEAILGRLNWQTLLITGLSALILNGIARAVWRAGLRHYSGTSA